jgi:hypothetical protein
LKGRISHFRIERHDNNTGVLQHLLKFIDRVVAVARWMRSLGCRTKHCLMKAGTVRLIGDGGNDG